MFSFSGLPESWFSPWTYIPAFPTRLFLYCLFFQVVLHQRPSLSTEPDLYQQAVQPLNHILSSSSK